MDNHQPNKHPAFGEIKTCESNQSEVIETQHLKPKEIKRFKTFWGPICSTKIKLASFDSKYLQTGNLLFLYHQLQLPN